MTGSDDPVIFVCKNRNPRRKQNSPPCVKGGCYIYIIYLMADQIADAHQHIQRAEAVSHEHFLVIHFFGEAVGQQSHLEQISCRAEEVADRLEFGVDGQVGEKGKGEHQHRETCGDVAQSQKQSLQFGVAAVGNELLFIQHGDQSDFDFVCEISEHENPLESVTKRGYQPAVKKLIRYYSKSACCAQEFFAENGRSDEREIAFVTETGLMLRLCYKGPKPLATFVLV